MGAARERGRYGHRDATTLLAYRHGLRAASFARCAGTRSTSRAACSMSADQKRNAERASDRRR